jgi:phosphoribosylamine-glycine ligase
MKKTRKRFPKEVLNEHFAIAISPELLKFYGDPRGMDLAKRAMDIVFGQTMEKKAKDLTAFLYSNIGWQEADGTIVDLRLTADIEHREVMVFLRSDMVDVFNAMTRHMADRRTADQKGSQ